jgi:hypothetical protein
MLKELVMRKSYNSFSHIGTGTVSALALAAMLMLHTGTAVAGTKPSAPSKPAAPVKPATPAVKPATPGAKPGATPVKPGGGVVKPGGGPVVKPGGGGPIKPGGGGGVPPKTVPHGPAPISQRDNKGNFGSKDRGFTGHVNSKGQITHMEHVAPNGDRMALHNSPTGVRRVETVSRDPYGHQVRTVGDGHRGYRERELMRRPGFRERTFYDREHPHGYARIYHDRVYGRWGAYPVYVPAYYYHPAFYAWFGVPWGAPVAFGWGAYPGYAVYGGYFAPAPYYASPGAWMADYIIAENLKAAYAAQQDAAADAAAAGTTGQIEAQTAPPAPIPQDVRSAYVQQVQDQVKIDQGQATGQPVPEDVPGALSPKFRVFQSYTDAEATDNNGQECALTSGDFVRREDDTPDSTKTVTVSVVSVAKPSASHCMLNAQVRVAVDTLQDWYNSFVAAQQAGFEAMAQQQGKNGFPAAPDVAKVVNPDGQATPDDPNAIAAEIQQQQTSAASMQAAAAGGGGGQ